MSPFPGLLYGVPTPQNIPTLPPVSPCTLSFAVPSPVSRSLPVFSVPTFTVPLHGIPKHQGLPPPQWPPITVPRTPQCPMVLPSLRATSLQYPNAHCSLSVPFLMSPSPQDPSESQCPLSPGPRPISPHVPMPTAPSVPPLHYPDAPDPLSLSAPCPMSPPRRPQTPELPLSTIPTTAAPSLVSPGLPLPQHPLSPSPFGFPTPQGHPSPVPPFCCPYCPQAPSLPIITRPRVPSFGAPTPQGPPSPAPQRPLPPLHPIPTVPESQSAPKPPPPPPPAR